MNHHPELGDTRPVSRRLVLAGSAAGLLSATGVAKAQSIAPDLAGGWSINGNGYAGALYLQHLANGRMGGSMYTAADVLQGYYCTSTLQLVLVRSNNGSIGQVFVGQVFRAGLVISGEFFALATDWGATQIRNRFAFSATRYPLTEPSPSSLPQLGVAGVGCLPPHFVVANRPGEFGRNWLINLNFTQSWLSCVANGVTGILDGDPIFGHYAPHSGSLVFLRMRDSTPFQFYRGQVSSGTIFNPTRITGDFFALSSEAGASPQRVAFDWATI